MTTRVTPLNLNDSPGVWTGPQSMVQPSVLLQTLAEGGGGGSATGTPLATPDTLFLRDGDASGAVGTLLWDGSLATPSAPATGFGQAFFDAASAAIILETEAARLAVTTNTGDGSHLVFGGDSGTNNVVTFYADALAQDGPNLSLTYDTAAVALQFDSFTLFSNTTPANNVTMTVSANGTLELTASSAATVVLQTPAADALSIIGGNGLSLAAPTGEVTTVTGDTIVHNFNSAAGVHQAPFYYGTVEQTDATNGDAITVPLADGRGLSFYLFVTAYTSTGPATAARQMVGICRAAGGTATVVNASSFYSNGDAALGAAAVSVVASGGNVIVRCTGVAGLTTRFEAYLFAFLASA